MHNIYGIPLLDNIHMLFPEILYDSTLFSHDETDEFGRILSWIRFRLSHLYPQTFNRARQNYAQNMARDRREDYDEWMWLRNRRELSPQQILMQRLPTMSSLQASLNTGFWGGEIRPVNTIYRHNNHTNYNNNHNHNHNTNEMDDNMGAVPNTTRNVNSRGSVDINNLLQNALIDEIIGGLLVPRATTRNTGGLWRFFDSVPIVPTPAEIAAGSRILESSTVAADTICAVCQDHDSPRDISGTVNVSYGWRILNSCNHIFHRECIDRWFEGHVVCPVCRADIRDRPNSQTSSGHSVAESVAESALSNPDL